ncbi:MAG TPA: GNAT family N-acetyltransferase [Polyangiaceae bacterium]|nr:GNAT family N-acetyltransferase [Polyangiaceae bacterium]
MSSEYHSERAGPEHAEKLLALFEGAGSGCFCNYWHFEGDKNAWLERCYLQPEANRAALVARLEAPELCGVVARTGAGNICGWLKVMRAEQLPRLYEQRVYRSLPFLQGPPGSREGVYAVGCVYVDEAERGKGVARSLLGAAIAAVRAAGGSALEAFPRGAASDEAEASERLRADQLWMGPQALFHDAGFVAVSDFRPYPVLRLHLR